MCTVKSIEGTTIFLHIEDGGEGSMILSEVAAGRIRNIREYVSPNKKIVCKVLKITDDHIELSLRRVTGKEREEILERYKKERTLISLLKAICASPTELVQKLRDKYPLWEFSDKLKEDPSIIEKFVSKQEQEKIAKLLLEKREKEKEVKRVFVLQSFSDSGLQEIKEILSVKDAIVKYLGSSQFSISSSASDFKEANNKINASLELIESRSKEKKAHFQLKEAK